MNIGGLKKRVSKCYTIVVSTMTGPVATVGGMLTTGLVQIAFFMLMYS